MVYITKRDGKQQSYERVKIFSAIAAACRSIGSEPEKDLLDEIVGNIEDIILKKSENDGVSVEYIQDLVEQKLMEKHLYDEAKSFILYRDRHARKRNDRNTLLAIIPWADNRTEDPLSEIFQDIEKEARHTNLK